MYNLFQFDDWYNVKHVTRKSGLDFNSLKEFLQNSNISKYDMALQCFFYAITQIAA